MSDEERRIADSQRSPMDEAAQAVPFGPPAYNEEDEQRPEPPGTSEAPERPTDADGRPIPPATSGGL